MLWDPWLFLGGHWWLIANRWSQVSSQQRKQKKKLSSVQIIDTIDQVKVRAWGSKVRGVPYLLTNRKERERLQHIGYKREGKWPPTVELD